MTTRLKGVTVAFGEDIREDDAEWIINAIKMIKGVYGVEPIEQDSKDFINRMQIRKDLKDKLYVIIDEL